MEKGWYIKTTEESNEVVHKWYYEKTNTSGEHFKKDIGNYYGIDDAGIPRSYIFYANANRTFPNCREILFEEFEELILGEKPNIKEEPEDYTHLIKLLTI